MSDFYIWPIPNGHSHSIAMFMEEVALDYQWTKQCPQDTYGETVLRPGNRVIPTQGSMYRTVPCIKQ
jgi:hypothetical protein